MNSNIISSVLTLKLAGDYKCTDNTDIIRLNMLAMELSNGNHTIDSVKETIGFRTASSNFNLSDEYILELIEKVKELEVNP